MEDCMRRPDHGARYASGLRRGAALGILLPVLLAGCDDAPAPPAADPRPVRVTTVAPRSGGDVISLTGTVEAETQVNLAFRIDGRMVERRVNVGDRVAAGQVVARLDRTNEENGLRAARAEMTTARARLTEARNNYQRQRELLQSGFTTRVRYDEATRTLRSAESALDATQAQVNIAQTRLGYTDLVADAGGVVTARGAEPGEVVQPGRMIVQVAREGGRDAVFDVPPTLKDQAPADPLIEVALTMDPAVRAEGRVREVSPQADPVTGTFRVRVGLADPPPAMRLGSTVTGRMELGAGGAIEVPASALTRAQQQPAVWVVDPAAQTVALRPVEVLRFDPARVVVGSGLEAGDIVVTAGVQALRPGQKVRLLGTQSAAR
ncbi:efflux RND transporter periplasmic adaptor subunit [Roseicella aquatilis]|uniref:Efflux RND transporter periplasmic adaptor subunit n=2 Tax=Roseicella aquatilis TaxID=2527868 RepID=A0A4R4DRK2_9PROT|nr:efflux RND transporter periplasmic adaptor subunit [Roseicella aquatilis]